MNALSTRVFLGSLAGALAILIFHQTTLQIFFWLGLSAQASFRIAHVPPFNAPLVVSITFWGAVYGGLLGLVLPWTRGPLCAKTAVTGMCATGLSWFVFLPLMGQATAFGWHAGPMLRSFAAYQMWGIGVCLLLPLLHPREIARRPADRGGRHLAA
jgi:hypothetical protein